MDLEICSWKTCPVGDPVVDPELAEGSKVEGSSVEGLDILRLRHSPFPHLSFGFLSSFVIRISFLIPPPPARSENRGEQKKDPSQYSDKTDKSDE